MTDDPIEKCIDLAALSPHKKITGEIVPAAREELTDLRAQVTEYDWLIHTIRKVGSEAEALWQRANSKPGVQPGYSVLLKWLIGRGDKAKAESAEYREALNKLADAADAYGSNLSFTISGGGGPKTMVEQSMIEKQLKDALRTAEGMLGRDGATGRLNLNKGEPDKELDGKPELANCPFCGTQYVDNGLSLLRADLVEPSDVARRAVQCLDCGARGPVEATEEKAVIAWNNATEVKP